MLSIYNHNCTPHGLDYDTITTAAARNLAVGLALLDTPHWWPNNGQPRRRLRSWPDPCPGKDAVNRHTILSSR
jgi:hypothetical protein